LWNRAVRREHQRLAPTSATDRADPDDA